MQASSSVRQPSKCTTGTGGPKLPVLVPCQGTRGVWSTRPQAQKGFGKAQPAKPVVQQQPKVAQKQQGKPTASKPAVSKPGAGAPMGFTATPAQLTEGNWIDCGSIVPDVVAFFQKAGKDVKAITLAAGRVLVLYRHQNVVYCSDVNSTAFQFPMVDASIIDGPTGPAVEVPLDGTVYDLLTGKVLKWCPKSDDGVKNFFATLKRSATPMDLPVFPTHVTETGKLRVRL